MRKTASFPARDKNLLKKQLLAWAGNFFSCILFDHNSYTQFNPLCEILVACGEWDTMTANGKTFSSLEKWQSSSHDWLFGFFCYDLKNEIEPKVFTKPDERFNGVPFPDAYFFKPQHIFELIGDSLIIHSVDEPEDVLELILQSKIPFPKNRSTPVKSRISKEDYLFAVNSIKEHIANGDLYEMNFCQEFYAENCEINPVALFIRLNEISPAPFACFVKHGEKYLLSASPERFLMKQGKKILSQPMKGTIRRNENAIEDAKQKTRLSNDLKERSENVMIVDVVRNDLARSAMPGSVNVDELCSIYTFPQVHQMTSSISAALRDEVHFIQAIKHAFPMGSMTGAPKIMAMQLIDEYEKTKRGLFSGSVGFITPEGDFDFNVVIRSILYNAAIKYLSFSTGSAITYDCISEYEYEECLLKAKGILQALYGKLV